MPARTLPRRRASLLAAFMLAAPTTLAQQPAPPASGDADRAEIRAAARELAIAQDMDAQVRATLRAIRGNLVGSLARSSPQASPASIASIVDDLLMPEFEARSAGLAASLEEAIARHYTAGEMRDLAAFYRTPLGRRLLDATPALAAEAMRIGQAWAEAAAGLALERHRGELRRRGLEL